MRLPRLPLDLLAWWRGFADLGGGRSGVADGTFRAGVVAGTVGAFLACGPDQREQSGRLLDLLVEGLRAR